MRGCGASVVVSISGIVSTYNVCLPTEACHGKSINRTLSNKAYALIPSLVSFPLEETYPDILLGTEWCAF